MLSCQEVHQMLVMPEEECQQQSNMLYGTHRLQNNTLFGNSEPFQHSESPTINKML